MSDPARTAWVAMRALVLDHDRRRDVATTLGLSFSRVRALLHLARGPKTAAALAELLLTDAPHCSVIVRELERRGLVERSPHPGDRRAKLVALTPDGAAAARRAADILETPPP